MVDLAGALLTVGGGAAEGTGKAMQTNALTKMKEEALRIRDENIARLRGLNQKASDERQFQNQGILNAEARRNRKKDETELYERGLAEDEKSYQRRMAEEEKKYQRRQTETSPMTKAKDQIDTLVYLGLEEETAKVAVRRAFTSKSNKALDMVKAFGKIESAFIESIGDVDIAREKAIEAFKLMGIPIPGLTDSGAGKGSESEVEKYKRRIAAMAAKKKEKESVTDKSGLLTSEPSGAESTLQERKDFLRKQREERIKKQASDAFKIVPRKPSPAY